MLLELERELSELKMKNVEEMDALKKENAMMKRKLEEVDHDNSKRVHTKTLKTNILKSPPLTMVESKQGASHQINNIVNIPLTTILDKDIPSRMKSWRPPYLVIGRV